MAKAFTETLAQHHAESLIKYVQTRVHRKGNTAEDAITLSNNAAADIIVPMEISDEAQLAIRKMDLTAEDLRDKILRWDAKAQRWLPEYTKDDTGGLATEDQASSPPSARVPDTKDDS